MGNIQRTVRANNANTRALLLDTQATRKQNDLLIEMFQEHKEENRKMSSYLQARITNLSQYFPLKDSATLELFLDESDGLFPLRRAEFYNWLLPCVTDKKNRFGTAILNTFFTKEFVKTHTWPTYR